MADVEHEFQKYDKIKSLMEFQPGTVNSIKFYSLDSDTDDLLIDNYQKQIWLQQLLHQQ